MRRILYLAAIALGLGTTASALAQGGGTGMGGGGGGSTFGGGSGGTGGSTFGGGGTGGTSFAGSSGGSSFSGTSGGSSFTGGTGTSFSGGTGTSGGGGAGGRTGVGGSPGSGSTFVPSTTGIFAAYYSNPLYPGRPGSTNISNKIVGGFGQPSFGAATTTTVQRTTTGQTGRTGTATVGNLNQNRNQNITPITYAMEVRFPAPPIVPTRLEADLQGLISRTTLLRGPSTVRVEVAGTTVILRGRVADDEERRLVEGMVRMEPGVREVRNELTTP